MAASCWQAALVHLCCLPMTIALSLHPLCILQLQANHRRAHRNESSKYGAQKLGNDVLPASAPGHVPRQAVGKSHSRIQVPCRPQLTSSSYEFIMFATTTTEQQPPACRVVSPPETLAVA